ncbi:MAG TPA: D-cysteine desulfhydrase family protein [Acidimicrobiia bacterium]|nr:D-cysteine desulfhydrase family protein [Acidimicrobiia bacterium]
MTLAPKVALAHLPTPLELMPRLTEWLGGPRLLVKRDDQTGLAMGGNKARKLEYLCAEAQAAGADVLVTGGGHQSNHVRMTAAAANRLGFEAHLVLGGDAPDASAGNLLLDRVLGATIEFCGVEEYYDVEAAIEEAAAQLERAGRRPFVLPIGGASATGALSYVEAADEVTAQLADLGATADWVVVADGSGGTHAGLVAGLDPRVRVVGVDVGTRPDLDEYVPDRAVEVAALAGRGPALGDVIVDHDHFGKGYGNFNPETAEALRETARLEGLLLDPVYTGKAMAALFSRVRDGRIGPSDTVVFWHTGGTPALFARHYERRLSEG